MSGAFGFSFGDGKTKGGKVVGGKKKPLAKKSTKGAISFGAIKIG